MHEIYRSGSWPKRSGLGSSYCTHRTFCVCINQVKLAGRVFWMVSLCISGQIHTRCVGRCVPAPVNGRCTAASVDATRDAISALCSSHSDEGHARIANISLTLTSTHCTCSVKPTKLTHLHNTRRLQCEHGLPHTAMQRTAPTVVNPSLPHTTTLHATSVNPASLSSFPVSILEQRSGRFACWANTVSVRRATSDQRLQCPRGGSRRGVGEGVTPPRGRG